MNHNIKVAIYKQIREEVLNMNNNICYNLKDLNKKNIYSKHNLYKYKSKNKNIYSEYNSCKKDLGTKNAK